MALVYVIPERRSGYSRVNNQCVTVGVVERTA